MKRVFTNQTMRFKRIAMLLLLIATATLTMSSACSRDDDDDNTPSTSTNQNLLIGRWQETTGGYTITRYTNGRVEREEYDEPFDGIMEFTIDGKILGDGVYIGTYNISGDRLYMNSIFPITAKIIELTSTNLIYEITISQSENSDQLWEDDILSIVEHAEKRRVQ